MYISIWAVDVERVRNEVEFVDEGPSGGCRRVCWYGRVSSYSAVCTRQDTRDTAKESNFLLSIDNAQLDELDEKYGERTSVDSLAGSRRVMMAVVGGNLGVSETRRAGSDHMQPQPNLEEIKVRSGLVGEGERAPLSRWRLSLVVRASLGLVRSSGLLSMSGCP